jgi:hypothetical protein
VTRSRANLNAPRFAGRIFYLTATLGNSAYQAAEEVEEKREHRDNEAHDERDQLQEK